MSSSAAGDLTPRVPSAAGDLTPRVPSAAGDLTPRVPSAAGDLTPRVPSAAGDLTPRVPSAAGDLTPRVPSAAGDLTPRAPSAAGDLTPRVPSAAGDPDDGGLRGRLHTRLAAVPRVRADGAALPGRVGVAVRASALLGRPRRRHVALLYEPSHLLHYERQVPRETAPGAGQAAQAVGQVTQRPREHPSDRRVSADAQDQRHVGQVVLSELGQVRHQRRLAGRGGSGDRRRLGAVALPVQWCTGVSGVGLNWAHLR